MKKICALDFLNKKTFNVDVYTESGVLLFHAGDEITPNILLRIYFKPLFINENDEEKILVEEQKIAIEKEKIHQNKEAEVASVLSKTIPEPQLAEEAEDKNTGREPVLAKEEELVHASAGKSPVLAEDDFDFDSKKDGKSPKPADIDLDKLPAVDAFGDSDKKDEEKEFQLEFKEEESNEVADLSVKFAQYAKYTEEQVEEIRQAAYYRNIGIKNFKNTDIKKPNFHDKVGGISYNMLKNEMLMSENIAEVSKLYYQNYSVKSFGLNPNASIPYYYLVGITDFYVTLKDKVGKEMALNKMVKIGGSKFNIFLLHKFVNMMRDADE